MKSTGFTYIEVMMAITIFLVLSALAVRLNITANKNMNIQIQKQNVMMEAQKCLEEYKNNPENYQNTNSQLTFKKSPIENNLFEIIITDNSSGEEILKSYFFEK